VAKSAILLDPALRLVTLAMAVEAVAVAMSVVVAVTVAVQEVEPRAGRHAT
jgi:hypothetical protein